MNTRICVTFSPDLSIVLPDGLLASELQMVREWTGGKVGNRAQWFDLLAEEDLDVLRATKLLALKRGGDSETRFDAVNFSFDTFDAYFIDDTGRTVEPDIEEDDNGDPIIGADGFPKWHKNADGSQRWRYEDTGEAVPPTSPDVTPRRSRLTLATTSGSSGISMASEPGTPPTSLPAE